MSVDLPGSMATWLSDMSHTRPFFRDPAFVAKFGWPGRGMLRAAVDEMKRRAESKAEAARIPVAWQAQLAQQPHHDGETR